MSGPKRIKDGPRCSPRKPATPARHHPHIYRSANLLPRWEHIAGSGAAMSLWNHIPIEALIGQNAGVGAGQPCAIQSWLRTLDEIRALPQTRTVP